ncbi:hypothetical protein ES703_86894 [subsurface metagenome]
MPYKEIKKSGKRIEEMIEAAEKKGVKLSEEQKKQMKENYFNKNKRYKI